MQNIKLFATKNKLNNFDIKLDIFDDNVGQQTQMYANWLKVAFDDKVYVFIIY